jgi:hypothetical protein
MPPRIDDPFETLLRRKSGLIEEIFNGGAFESPFGVEHAAPQATKPMAEAPEAVGAARPPVAEASEAVAHPGLAPHDAEWPLAAPSHEPSPEQREPSPEPSR